MLERDIGNVCWRGSLQNHLYQVELGRKKLSVSKRTIHFEVRPRIIEVVVYEAPSQKNQDHKVREDDTQRSQMPSMVGIS